MIILGIHGAIGHGKTTFADQLRKIEPDSAPFESSTIIAEVLDELHKALKEPFEADPVTFVKEWLIKLPPIVKKVVNVEATAEQLSFSDQELLDQPARFQKLLEHATKLQQRPELARQIITAQNKALYRPGLQGLGGYLVFQVGPTIWYDEIVRRITTEVADKELILVGGLRFPADEKVIRTAGGVIIEIVRPDMPAQDSQDPTEVFRKQIVNDSQVINNGDQEQLAQLAPQILSDIRASTLKPSYVAFPSD